MNRKLAAVLLIGAIPILGACSTTRMTSVDQGNALYRNGRFEAASLAFDNAIIEHPESVAAYNNRASTRVHLGHAVGALGDYTKAIELSPADPELYFNRANAYMALGNYDFAVQDLNRAVELAPGYSKAYFNRGTARFRMGDTAGADGDWRYAIALEPDPWTQSAMVRSAGLGSSTEPVRTAVADIPGTLTTAAATNYSPPPSAMPGFTDLSATSETLDARALALRGLSRELDGDRTGALADLRAAQDKETDSGRRALLAEQIRRLETAP